MAGGIYKITSPKGKVYIGQTSNFNRRKSEHKYLSSQKYITKLYSSIKKYGFQSHKFEVLEKCDDKSLRDELEQFYINKYDSINNGLNLIDVVGGHKGFSGKKHSNEEVERIKKRMNGVVPTWAIKKRKKSVHCLMNKKTYDSISECANDLNVSQSLVSMQLSGKRLNTLNVVRK